MEKIVFFTVVLSIIVLSSTLLSAQDVCQNWGYGCPSTTTTLPVSTTTTLPVTPCSDTFAPTCGGWCPDGQTCLQVVFGLPCSCFATPTTTTTLPGCEASGVGLYPTCGGSCPAGQNCVVHPDGYPTCTCVDDLSCPVPETRSDIIVDLTGVSNPECNAILLAKTCKDNNLKPGDTVTIKYKDGSGSIMYTPGTCPASACESTNGMRCSLPPGCVPALGTTQARAEWLACYITEPMPLTTCSDYFHYIADWNFIPTGYWGECTALSSAEVIAIRVECGVDWGSPYYNVLSEEEKVECAYNKVNDAIWLKNFFAGCQRWVCRHSSSCLNSVLYYNAPGFGGFFIDGYCGHAWNEYSFDSGFMGGKKLVLDSYNKIALVCDN